MEIIRIIEDLSCRGQCVTKFEERYLCGTCAARGVPQGIAARDAGVSRLMELDNVADVEAIAGGDRITFRVFGKNDASGMTAYTIFDGQEVIRRIS